MEQNHAKANTPMRPGCPVPEIYSDTYKDIYFCEEDGLAEGDHVFLKGNGLPERWLGRESFVVAETGFGTGLNFLATWLAWERTAKPGQHLTYISFEKYPLTPDQIREALSRWRVELTGKLDIMLENYPARITGWHSIRISDDISLLLIFDDVNIALPELETNVDAWFLDGFAPAKNPEMWSETVFRAIAENSCTGTTVASFTAAGIVKRGLREVGFEIAKTRGFGRKRDMIYGRFLSEKAETSKSRIKSVAVIGGGLAGCNAAYRLNQENIEVDIYEANEIASGASGNWRGLFNPRFTAQRSAISDFYASGYALVLRQFKKLNDIDFKSCGSLHLLTDEDKARRFKGAAENWSWNEDHLKLVGTQEASEFAGIAIDKDCLFLPDSGFVSPAKICDKLADGLSVVQEKVETLVRDGLRWLVNGRAYDAVIIACGVGVMEFEQSKNIPVSSVRGQITVVKATPETEKVRTNICYGGYFSPAMEGFHVAGSTFQPWLTDIDIREEDNADIVAALEENVPALSKAIKVTKARAALRVAAKDRFPVIGKLEENLYISAAHGSHGLISSSIAAEIVTADILNRPAPVPKSVIRALSPQRFSRLKP